MDIDQQKQKNVNRELLHKAIVTKVEEIFDTNNKYVKEAQVDTVPSQLQIPHNEYFVTFKMNKGYEYSNDLFCDFSNILHAQHYWISVRRNFLTLKYLIDEKGARELAREKQKQSNPNHGGN